MGVHSRRTVSGGQVAGLCTCSECGSHPTNPETPSSRHWGTGAVISTPRATGLREQPPGRQAAFEESRGQKPNGPPANPSCTGKGKALLLRWRTEGPAPHQLPTSGHCHLKPSLPQLQREHRRALKSVCPPGVKRKYKTALQPTNTSRNSGRGQWDTKGGGKADGTLHLPCMLLGSLPAAYNPQLPLTQLFLYITLCNSHPQCGKLHLSDSKSILHLPS